MVIAGEQQDAALLGNELAHVYPFRVWRQDLLLWAECTDLDERKLGASVAGRLGGVARSLAREMPIDIIRDGQTLGDGTHVSGLQTLMRALSRRFAPLSFEVCFTSMVEYMQFRRGSN